MLQRFDIQGFQNVDPFVLNLLAIPEELTIYPSCIDIDFSLSGSCYTAQGKADIAQIVLLISILHSNSQTFIIGAFKNLKTLCDITDAMLLNPRGHLCECLCVLDIGVVTVCQFRRFLLGNWNSVNQRFQGVELC